MLSLPPSTLIYLATVPVDLRKSFDALSGLILSLFGLDPLCGHLFVFFNKRQDLVKILFWDRTGFVLYAKKLAQGRFHFHKYAENGETKCTLEAAELFLVLEGLDLSEAKRCKRWRPPLINVPSK